MKIDQSNSDEKSCWYTSRRFRINTFTLIGIIIIYQGIWTIFFRHNDFLWHFNLGRNFIEGDPYRNGGDWYTVGRMMINALLGYQNYYMARATSFMLSLIALAYSLKMWNRIAYAGRPVSGSVAFAAAVFSLGMLSPFVLRDLDDCGLQIFLLFILTSAANALNSGRPILSGFWLGVAVTYKATPMLFLPFLLWKRQWKPAFWMVVFLLIVNLLPALFIGWETTKSSNIKWLERVQKELKVQDPLHPTSYEPPRHQNQSLPYAIARYLQSYPADHALYLEHPLFFQFGKLDKTTANYVVKGILLIMACILAWLFRYRWSSGLNKSDLAVEWAAVTLLCALLSPLRWLHHLVLALPCMFLTIRYQLHTGYIPSWHKIIMGFIAFKILLLQRLFLGHDLSVLVLSYKLDALAVLLVMILLLSIPNIDTHETLSS